MATYFSIQAAADYLGVSTSTLRNWERDGRIAASMRTPSNHRRYTKADLDAILSRPATREQVQK
jgi:excisionase family DNA binding protein